MENSTVWKFFKKLQMALSYDPEIPLLGIYPKEFKPGCWRDIYTPVSYIIHNSQEMEATQTSINKWIKKRGYIHTMEYYVDLKKKGILSYAATWMNLDDIPLSEISQLEKDKYCMIPFIWSI